MVGEIRIRTSIVILIGLILFGNGCRDSETGPSTDQWESLGFEDKFALRLVLAEPYLYVCAGSDGLWRRDIRRSGSDWEYVGLADTSLGRYFNRGVLDVLIHGQNPNWLLVAYQPDQAADHRVYSSDDRGSTWSPADSGLEEYINGMRYFKSIWALMDCQGYILGAGEGVYRTLDFGQIWIPIETPPWTAGDVLERHPRAPNIFWLGGEGLLFQPLLSFSRDGGFTWTGINLQRHGVPIDNAVYSIAFDPIDTNIVYIGMQGAMVKTTDGGQSWLVPLVTHPQGAFFRAILSDPRDKQHYWVAAGRSVMETFDAGRTWGGNQSPNEHQVLDMLWDDMTQSIYIATESKIYRYKP